MHGDHIMPPFTRLSIVTRLGRVSTGIICGFQGCVRRALGLGGRADEIRTTTSDGFMRCTRQKFQRFVPGPCRDVWAQEPAPRMTRRDVAAALRGGMNFSTSSLKG